MYDCYIIKIADGCYSYIWMVVTLIYGSNIDIDIDIDSSNTSLEQIGNEEDNQLISHGDDIWQCHHGRTIQE